MSGGKPEDYFKNHDKAYKISVLIIYFVQGIEKFLKRLEINVNLFVYEHS